MTDKFRTVAVLIPSQWRARVYAALGVLAAAEGIVLIARPELAGWITAIFGVAQALGFAVARSNVPRQP